MASTMTAVANNDERPRVTAPELMLKIVLTGTQMHYEHADLVDEKRLDHMLHCGKTILYKSHQESEVRQNLGFSHAVWQGLTEVLTFAIPELERKSFSWKNPPESSFNGSSSDVIAFNYFTIIKDIERLNDLCTIARNLLATTKKAQNLAAEKGFDQQILKLIDVCVRVTARGFDGENNPRNEERWQKVVTLYKRLLITCLQFLHNFIMHNEHRKLVLWLDLFGNSQQQTEADLPPLLPSPEMPAISTDQEARIKATVENLPSLGTLTDEGGLGYNIDDVHALFDLMSTERPPDGTTQEAARLLMDKIRSDMERLSGLSATQLDENPDALLKVGAALRAQLPTKDFPLEPNGETAQQVRKAIVSIDRTAKAGQSRAIDWTDLPDVKQYNESHGKNNELTDEDMSMPRSSQSAAETLQEAKDELMARLQETTPLVEEGTTRQEPAENRDKDDVDAEINRPVDIVNEEEDEENDEDEDEDEDEDFRSPGDQERGLLTDVPLVLGPTEIEALPMIIQAGIVDSFGLKGGERSGTKNMQAVRCHILLAQEAGRNVLRELLIFIAACDLPDDEFYFKMMVQIMEAILNNGLMSHAYSDFGQVKDIISPAQAVVIKILTHIFRAKYSPTSISGNNNHNTSARIPAKITKVDVLTVRYIFTVFRGNIIPETCALIYLQGRIRAGHALAEDFPLNLWDMERVYEGVYQFLEFFAVLTESNDWKALLVEWEIVYDLVTLIKELDASIPKAALTHQIPHQGPSNQPKASEATNSAAAAPAMSNGGTAAPLSVERPYDPALDPSSATSAAPATDSTTSPIPDQQAQPPPPPSASPPLGTEDPSEFEWRNLKKLIVLVLSSLVWKSPLVQNQIRAHSGVEVILGCTQYDAHNPYIKEHAVMCLKFLLEENAENQKIVRELEAREVVTNDGKGNVTANGRDGILEKLGVQAKLGEGGKVRLEARPKPA